MVELSEAERERFWAKVQKSDGCWVWTAALAKGYGVCAKYLGGRKWRHIGAHRVAYELLVGPVPEGLDLDHLCRNRACVNPAHLEAVSRRENLRRGAGWSASVERCKRLSEAKRTRSHCANGHEFTEENTYRWRNTRLCRTCRMANLARYKRAAAAG